jgi:tripartite-type tricarboxylate transporter receptor subunit TctC
VADTVAGQVPLLVLTAPAALSFTRSGKLRALAVTGNKRSDFAPDLPTLSESGLPGYEVSGWFGVFAPTGTPQPIIEAISGAVAKAVKDPPVRSALIKDGDTPVGNSPAEFAKEVQGDIAKWRRVIKEANIQME